MKLGIDYKFVDDMFDAKSDGTTVPIELLEKPFNGIIYRYTQVAFKMDGDIPRMLFDYEIIKTNDLSMMTLRKNEKFNTILGLILNALLIEAAEVGDEARTNNIEESDSNTELYEEGSAVSKT